MALTRRALKAMGIEDEKIDEIITMHTDTVDGLKADVAKYKADAVGKGAGGSGSGQERLVESEI